MSGAPELRHPARPNGRAALVLHEAPGVGEHVRRRCAMLAARGYVAYAPDLHGHGRLLAPDESATAIADLRAQPAQLRERVRIALEHLCGAAGVNSRQVAVIGYCFGGLAALELARDGARVAAIASFHGLLTTRSPALRGAIQASVLVCTGARDPLAPAQDVMAFGQEMDAAGADWRLVVYGQAAHSFTNAGAAHYGDPRMRHDPRADAASWRQLVDFLDEAFAAP